MNREIKFRAWDGKRMTTSGIMFNTSTGCLEVPNKLSFNEGNLPDDMRYKLMQFTGLHDKNGKEIYEGDIVDSGYFKKAIVVSWEYGWYFHVNNDYFSFRTAQHTFEIIGNIYENKDLI